MSNLLIDVVQTNGFDGRVTVLNLELDGVRFELTPADITELFETLKGNRGVWHSAIEDGNYYPKMSFMSNRPTKQTT